MKKIKISDIVEVFNGYAFDSDSFNSDGKGLPIIRIRDVVPGYSETYYSGEYPKEYLIDNGALLVGMDGEFNIEFWKGGKALLNQRVCQIIPKNSVDILFLKYRLSLLLKKIEDETPFVTVKHLSSEKLKDEVIEIPPLTEQKRIASLLARADRLRSLRRTARELGESLLQSVFLEMFGEPVRNEKRWEKDCLQNYTSLITSGSTPLGGSNVYKSQGYRFIRSQNVLMNEFDFSDIAYIDEKIYNSMKRTFVKQNDVLLNITGASIGRVACYQDDIPANVNQHVCIIRCKSEELNPIYLSYLIGMNTFQEKIISEQSGATRQAFTFDQIGDFEIIIPPLNLQEEFASVVRRVESLRARQAEGERQAQGLFEALLGEAFEQ